MPLESRIGLGLLIFNAICLAFIFAVPSWRKELADRLSDWLEMEGFLGVLALSILINYFGVVMYTPTGMAQIDTSVYALYALVALVCWAIALVVLTVVWSLLLQSIDKLASLYLKLGKK